MQVDRRIALVCVVLFALAAGAGCAVVEPTGPVQSLEVKKTAVDLKVEANSLMAKATEPYSQHQAAAEKFQMDMDKAYEFSRSIPKNEITTQQWAMMKDPNQPLMGGFLKRWKEKSTLPAAYIQEKQKLIGEGFDEIIQLEEGKPKG
jgi:hypothetical protein